MPLHAAIGKSNKKDYKLAVAEALYQAKKKTEGRLPSLAIVLTSIEYASPYLLTAISNRIGKDVPILGATNNAILADDKVHSRIIAIVLISAEEAYCNIASLPNTQSNLEAESSELAKQLLLGLGNAGRRFCLLFSDKLIIDNPSFLNGFRQVLGQSFPIIGANITPDETHPGKSYRYFNQKVLSDTTVGALWAGRVNFGLGIKHGWKPIGKPHRVSSVSKEFTIKEIEKKPAVLLYQDYFAKDALELKKELNRISCLYPLGMRVSGEEEFIIRNIVSIEHDGSLVCRGDVPVNSEVRLMIGTKESCLQATEEAASEAKKALETQAFPRKKPASLVFVFNSASRLYLLGRKIKRELEIIQSYFPQSPIIGLCSHGEIAPLKTTEFAGKSYSHNQTISILAIN